LPIWLDSFSDLSFLPFSGRKTGYSRERTRPPLYYIFFLLPGRSPSPSSLVRVFFLCPFAPYVPSFFFFSSSKFNGLVFPVLVNVKSRTLLFFPAASPGYLLFSSLFLSDEPAAVVPFFERRSWFGARGPPFGFSGGGDGPFKRVRVESREVLCFPFWHGWPFRLAFPIPLSGGRLGSAPMLRGLSSAWFLPSARLLFFSPFCKPELLLEE